MKLIGLSGTNGSGKDTIGQLLQNKFGFLFVSVSDMLRLEAEKRGLSTTREVLRDISAVEYYEQQGGDNTYKGLAIASLRNPGENDRVHELGGQVIWIDADPHVRYDRLKGRMRADDPQTFEEFIAHEQAELEHSGDKATLSMQAVKESADMIFENDHNDVDLLQQRIKAEMLTKSI